MGPSFWIMPNALESLIFQDNLRGDEVEKSQQLRSEHKEQKKSKASSINNDKRYCLTTHGDICDKAASKTTNDLGENSHVSSSRSGFTHSIRSWTSSSESEEEERCFYTKNHQQEESHKHRNMVTILTCPTITMGCSRSSDAHKGPTAAQEENIEVRIAEEKMPMLLVRNRSLNLPTASYYSSNHIMINSERTSRQIPALIRNSDLDYVARSHAEAMAKDMKLYHSNPTNLREGIGQADSCLFIGENVSMGPTIRVIHRRMTESASDLNNMLDQRFKEMGMATARGFDGTLFLCQLFRG